MKIQITIVLISIILVFLQVILQINLYIGAKLNNIDKKIKEHNL
ncbi:hypothetical protein [Melghiribacillus thermohalophilus]|nr:hypothetical protein [Melghiribacillus thermohalophilus]